MFVIEKVWDRWARMPDVVRTVLTTIGNVTLRYGVPVAVLLLGVPGGLYLLGKLPGDSSDQPSLPSALLALVDPTKQGLASFSALVVVLIGLGKSVWNGLAVEGKSAPGLRARLLAFARTKLAPWVGSTIIVVAAVIVLLRWTGGYATDRSYQEDWNVALVLAAIAVAIKVLTDANRTSLHSFYRERLSRAFLVTRKDNGAAVALDYHLRLRYSDWAKPVNGGPHSSSPASRTSTIPTSCRPSALCPVHLRCRADRDGRGPVVARRRPAYDRRLRARGRMLKRR